MVIWGKARSPGLDASPGTPDAVLPAPPPSPRLKAEAGTVQPGLLPGSAGDTTTGAERKRRRARPRAGRCRNGKTERRPIGPSAAAFPAPRALGPPGTPQREGGRQGKRVGHRALGELVIPKLVLARQKVATVVQDRSSSARPSGGPFAKVRPGPRRLGIQRHRGNACGPAEKRKKEKSPRGSSRPQPPRRPGTGRPRSSGTPTTSATWWVCLGCKDLDRSINM